MVWLVNNGYYNNIMNFKSIILFSIVPLILYKMKCVFLLFRLELDELFSCQVTNMN